LPPGLSPLLIGLATGILVSAAAARVLVRRHLRRMDEAERRARAAERLAEVGAMTGGLAHEIKNPLSTIGLNAQLLGEAIDELELPEADKGRLSRRIGALRREVERLRGILTDFLQYAGQLRLEPRPADLNQVVAELGDFFLPQAEKQNVRLRLDLCSGTLAASLDTAHVKQALLNLMLNAVQAMGDPLKAAPADGPRELILRTGRENSRGRRPWAVVHVIDTGPGIDAATLGKIFDPYFTTKSGGTGLGLPTAKRIIEGHEGRLEVHTEPGRGTDFAASFPALPPDSVTTATPDADPAASPVR
jgi:signal transduction histidine kinase